MGIQLQEQESPARDIIEFDQLTKTSLWYQFSENRFTYVVINHTLRVLISHIANTSKIIPNEAISAIYQRLPQIEDIISIHLSESLRGTSLSSDSRPIIRISNSGSSNLRIELSVKPHGDKTFPCRRTWIWQF